MSPPTNHFDHRAFLLSRCVRNSWETGTFPNPQDQEKKCRPWYPFPSSSASIMQCGKLDLRLQSSLPTYILHVKQLPLPPRDPHSCQDLHTALKEPERRGGDLRQSPCSQTGNLTAAASRPLAQPLATGGCPEHTITENQLLIWCFWCIILP